MKNRILAIIVILAFLIPSLLFAQTEIRPDQIRGGVYTKAQTDAAIENAIADIPTPSSSQTVNIEAGEALSSGDVVSIINQKAYKNALTVNQFPNGSESVFNSAATTYCSAVALDSTRFLVAYVDDTNVCRAIVGTVSGSSISWGSESAAFFDVPSALSGCLINTDKVLFAARDTESGGTGKMVVCSISNSTVAVGTITNFRSGNVNNVSVSKLDTDKVILCYRDQDDSKLRGKIITISSTTPTPFPDATTVGTQIDTGTVNYVSCSALSATSAIVCFQDGGDGSKGKAQVLSISGTTITPGTEYTFLDGNAAEGCKVTTVDDTHAVIAFRDTIATGYPTAVFATNNAGTLSFGANCVIKSSDAGAFYMGLNTIDATHFLVSFRYGTTDSETSVLTLSGTSLSASTPVVFNTGTTTYITNCYLGNQKSVICYTDASNSNYGTSVINTYATPSYSSISGVSVGSYSSGATASVLLQGTQSGYSNLVVGQSYYVDASYGIGTLPVLLDGAYVRIGDALTSTQLFVH